MEQALMVLGSAIGAGIAVCSGIGSGIGQDTQLGKVQKQLGTNQKLKEI